MEKEGAIRPSSDQFWSKFIKNVKNYPTFILRFDAEKVEKVMPKRCPNVTKNESKTMNKRTHCFNLAPVNTKSEPSLRKLIDGACHTNHLIFKWRKNTNRTSVALGGLALDSLTGPESVRGSWPVLPPGGVPWPPEVSR